MSLSKKITLCALMASIAIVFGYIEMLFPLPVAIPGIKLGLGNIAILVCLYLLGYKTAFFVMLIKVFVTTLLFSSPSMLIYSLFGGVLSFLIMAVLKKLSFNIITISIGGGVFHNIGQLTAAIFVMRGINVIYYSALLIPSGAAIGAVTGIVAKIIIKRINVIIKK